MTHDTYLEKLARLCLHSFGCVNDHNRRIRRHQCSVRILRKVLMARRIQNIDAKSAIRKLQYRRRNRDSSLLLDLHPVGNRMSCSRFSLYPARQVDRSAIQQEFLRQGCLTCIRMRYDRKSPSFVNLLRVIAHVIYPPASIT